MQRKRGRPQTIPGNRSNGRPVQALRSGRPRQLPDVPAKAWKPIRDMTPDEKRAYSAAQKRASRARRSLQRKENLRALCDPSTLPSEPVEWREHPRVFAPDDATAQFWMGPDAVAVQKCMVTIRRDLRQEARNVAYFLGARGRPTTFSELLEINLEDTLKALRHIFNDGEPFPEPEVISPTRQPYKVPSEVG